MIAIKDIEIDDPGGRPSKYRPEFAEIARKVILNTADCSDASLARMFRVGKATICRWKYEHEDFRNAYYEAWDYVSVHGVEKSLLKLAIGYEYKEITREPFLLTGELKITKEVTKYAAPNKGAIEMILKNRAGKRWPKGESRDGLPPLELHIHTKPKGEADYATSPGNILPDTHD
jgi:hypothetical protein